MDTTFYFGVSLPATGSFIKKIDDRTSAVNTAYAGIASIMQRVVGYTVCQDIGPHPITSPMGQRINFYQVIFGIPAH
jgi:hypothetical protein